MQKRVFTAPKGKSKRGKAKALDNLLDANGAPDRGKSSGKGYNTGLGFYPNDQRVGTTPQGAFGANGRGNLDPSRPRTTATKAQFK